MENLLLENLGTWGLICVLFLCLYSTMTLGLCVCSGEALGVGGSKSWGVGLELSRFGGKRQGEEHRLNGLFPVQHACLSAWVHGCMGAG